MVYTIPPIKKGWWLADALWHCFNRITYMPLSIGWNRIFGGCCIVDSWDDHELGKKCSNKYSRHALMAWLGIVESCFPNPCFQNEHELKVDSNELKSLRIVWMFLKYRKMMEHELNVDSCIFLKSLDAFGWKMKGFQLSVPSLSHHYPVWAHWTSSSRWSKPQTDAGVVIPWNCPRKKCSCFTR